MEKKQIYYSYICYSINVKNTPTLLVNCLHKYIKVLQDCKLYTIFTGFVWSVLGEIIVRPKCHHLVDCKVCCTGILMLKILVLALHWLEVSWEGTYRPILNRALEFCCFRNRLISFLSVESKSADGAFLVFSELFILCSISLCSCSFKDRGWF